MAQPTRENSHRVGRMRRTERLAARAEQVAWVLLDDRAVTLVLGAGARVGVGTVTVLTP